MGDDGVARNGVGVAGHGDQSDFVDRRECIERIAEVGCVGDAHHEAAAAAVVEETVDRVRKIAVAGIDRRIGVGRGHRRFVAHEIAEQLGELRPVGDQLWRLRGGAKRKVHVLGRGWVLRGRSLAGILGNKMDLVGNYADKAGRAGADTRNGLDGRRNLFHVHARGKILWHGCRSSLIGCSVSA